MPVEPKNPSIEIEETWSGTTAYVSME